ncbi:gamma-glutamyl-gamma-aminobutyrate hydrolase family protein [Nafulsella turpanensis]|uniref:gamma-glutamyl-gamma-aminobutyrate hydrolase family protein n=1 Tax=Nafulsella turpanensis TaxID=1265690 RepID=UPI000345C53A|nr:gamma-glutamyl-gamma-aminobutyrate hydrolase family protein [Nafulsella turpanensis]
MAFLTNKHFINRTVPTIGVTGPDKGGGMAWFFTSLAVRLAGGRPVRITPSRPRTADGLQGLIIGGGADVDPATYQKDNVVEEYLDQTIRKPHRSIFQKVRRTARWLYYPALFLARKLFSRGSGFGLDRERDHLEFQLIDQAIKKGIPLMGICRGSQLINVYFKGTLYQDINAFYLEEPNPSSVFPVKKVHIKRGSKLAEVLGIQHLKVNALHNQAVKDTGENIQIVAREANDVVQGIEREGHDFVIGVQWHPEYLPQRKHQRAIFKALVKYAREVQQQIEYNDLREALSKPVAPELEEMEQEETQTRQKVQSL